NLRAPIPLLTPLNVVRTAAGWALLDGDTLIMDAVPRAEILGQFTSTEPADFDAAQRPA
ncbi:MAG: hypothetical protein GY929_27150, partial [Actinomycetia bacterium]|nr:hypothetical protein [Actinomycetes bacterium]